jgi:dTDP-4-amino-4,6-dideoxygalactose transaminase
LIVDEPRLLEKARRIRWFGIDRELIRTEVNIDEKGYKYNPNEVMAAMGLIQLKHIDWIVEKHMVNADWFESHLDETVGLPKATADRSSYWTYTIFSDHRDKIEAHLKTNGIGCGTVHRPNIYHIIFRNRFEIEPHEHLFLGDSGLSKFHNTALHIPCGWWVTPDDREYIAEKIEEALA